MGTLIDVTIPEDQLEGTESVLTQWFVQVGERAEIHEPLLELTTDKVTVEIAAPASGILAEQLKGRDDAVAPGDLVARIDPSGAAAEPAHASKHGGAEASAPVASAGAGKDDRVEESAGAQRLSPSVRKLLEENAIEPSAIRGTGRGGRITHRDVLAFIESGSGPAAAGAAAPDAGATISKGRIASRKIPHSPMRSMIARHMVTSALETAPHVTAVFETDLTRVLADRARLKPELERQGVRLTLTAYLVAAAVSALQKVPEINSRWHDDALELYEDINVGIATALEPDGLIVPVLHRAQDHDLAALAARLQDLTARARSGGLDPKEVRNGTFTITNHGVSGSLIATPIINQPQSAILGVGKLQKRAVVVERNGADEIRIRPMAFVTLTIDHRALDGFKANQFLSAFCERLESWS